MYYCKTIQYNNNNTKIVNTLITIYIYMFASCPSKTVFNPKTLHPSESIEFHIDNNLYAMQN